MPDEEREVMTSSNDEPQTFAWGSEKTRDDWDEPLSVLVFLTLADEPGEQEDDDQTTTGVGDVIHHAA